MTTAGVSVLTFAATSIVAAASVVATVGTSADASPLPSSVRAVEFPGRAAQPERLDRPAPRLDLDRWLDRAEPLTLEQLRGRPVLVRWWTDTCPFCATSMPVLETLHRTYGPRGLAVLGVFHPKPAAAVDDARVRRAADRFGVTFPIAVDADWDALRRWWLGEGQGWTSVTFLLDADGLLRWIHPGGEFHPGDDGGPHWPRHDTCVREYDTLRTAVETLLNDAGKANGPG